MIEEKEYPKIPDGTKVSFKDPITGKPVAGVVLVEYIKFVNVKYDVDPEDPKKFKVVTFLPKEKVFVVR